MKSKFKKPQKLFDHREDSIKSVLADLHYRMRLANVHPYLFCEFLSLGEICIPWTQQKVMRDIQLGGNGHVKLPSPAQLCGANADDNPSQTFESILYLFKTLAYYGTEFTMRRSIETIVDVCRSMRMIHTVPASFDGLRDLWDRMSDELDSVQE